MLAAAAERTLPVIRAVRDDQLGLDTPCAEFRVRDLLNHLFQVVVNFQALAVREQPDFSTTPDVLTGDWRQRFADETATLIKAWSDPAALEGVSPGMGLPQAVVGNLVLVDLVVHGWDLAQATGQSYEPDPATVTALAPIIEQMAPQGRQMGVFGAEVAAREDATDFERMLAVSGRTCV
ncbi:TIGR03086 family protein [Paractinoplanes deccanensis]|uniref:TIGR03086 family protein n=1 Tax=Paractinoplanes deccanensis TaxID=113561 RepID=A0ABQ3Y872_9ACTN|nr:TIGR03086 family protein [Actinoplanes deccanensis]